MNKNELILLLKQYKENRAKLNIKLKELNILRLRLKALEDIDVSISSGNYEINSDIHSKNQISDKVGNKVAINEDRKKEILIEIENIEAEIRDLREKTEPVEDRIQALTEKEEILVKSYYIEKLSYYEIGNRIYLDQYKETRSGDSIKRTIKEAVKKMIKI